MDYLKILAYVVAWLPLFLCPLLMYIAYRRHRALMARFVRQSNQLIEVGHILEGLQPIQRERDYYLQTLDDVNRAPDAPENDETSKQELADNDSELEDDFEIVPERRPVQKVAEGVAVEEAMQEAMNDDIADQEDSSEMSEVDGELRSLMEEEFMAQQDCGETTGQDVDG